MNNFYAQITPGGPGGLVVGVSELAGEIIDSRLVPITQAQASADLLGQVWTGSEFIDNPDPEPVPMDTSEALRLAQKALAIRELPDTIRFLDAEERGEASRLFPAWRPDGMAVEAGEVYRFDGDAWRVVQDHTTQASWTPPTVPALFEAL